MQNHQPSYINGTVDRDGKFVVEGVEASSQKSPVDIGLAEVV